MTLVDQMLLLSPVLAAVGTALAVIGVDLFLPRAASRACLAIVTAAGLVFAVALSVGLWQGTLVPGRELADHASIFEGTARVDRFALYLWAVIAGSAILTSLMSMGYDERRGLGSCEYYALISFAAAGMMLLVASTHLVTLFLALETLSVSIYSLVGMLRNDPRSSEGAIKYFVQGAFAAGFLVYGVALIYGATRELSLELISTALSSGRANLPLFLAGLALAMVGMAFKIGAVPFHWWVADAYEGAASPVTAFMASGVKVAAFGFLARVLMSISGRESDVVISQGFWVDAVAVLALATMGLGTLAALAQTNIKRLLATSSIVHTGYMLIPLVAATRGAPAEALSGLPLYLAVYSLMTLGAFACVAALEKEGREREGIVELAGLASKRPGVALVLAICLLSLAGLPPTAGFVGKFQIFLSAVDAGYAWLALAAIVASLVSLYYYLRVLMTVYMEESRDEFVPDFDPWGVAVALVAAGAGTLVLGVLPGRLIELSIASARSVFAGF